MLQGLGPLTLLVLWDISRRPKILGKWARERCQEGVKVERSRVGAVPAPSRTFRLSKDEKLTLHSERHEPEDHTEPPGLIQDKRPGGLTVLFGV